MNDYVNVLREKLSSNSHDDDGRHCHFVKWNDEIGLKVYRDKERRNHAYKMQKLGSMFDLCPRAWGRFEFDGSVLTNYGNGYREHKQTLYGYCTQILMIIEDLIDDGVVTVGDEDNYHCWPGVKDLHERCVKHRFFMSDAYRKNYGWDEHYKMYIIDTGDCTFERHKTGCIIGHSSLHQMGYGDAVGLATKGDSYVPAY